MIKRKVTELIIKKVTNFPNLERNYPRFLIVLKLTKLLFFVTSEGKLTNGFLARPDQNFLRFLNANYTFCQDFGMYQAKYKVT